jgi:hypothetical protein
MFSSLALCVSCCFCRDCLWIKNYSATASAITSAAGAGTTSTGAVGSTGAVVAGADAVFAGAAGFVVGFFAAAFFSGESTIVIFRPSSLAMVSTRAN